MFLQAHTLPLTHHTQWLAKTRFLTVTFIRNGNATSRSTSPSPWGSSVAPRSASRRSRKCLRVLRNISAPLSAVLQCATTRRLVELHKVKEYCLESDFIMTWFGFKAKKLYFLGLTSWSKKVWLELEIYSIYLYETALVNSLLKIRYIADSFWKTRFNISPNFSWTTCS